MSEEAPNYDGGGNEPPSATEPPAKTPEATPPAPVSPLATDGAEGGNEPPKQDPAASGAGEPKKDGKPPLRSPLELDDPEGKGAKANEPSKTEPPKTETLTAEQWLEKSGIAEKALDIGKDLYGNARSISTDELKAMAPLLQEAGVSPEGAPKVLEILSQITQIRSKAEESVYNEHIERMAKEQKEYFGEDFERVRREAIAGIREVFPTEYGKLLSSLPEIGFSKEFMEAMAKVGRMFTNDDGTGGTAAADNNREQWDFKRWMAHDKQ